MLNVIMLNVIMLSVIMLNVIMLNVAALLQLLLISGRNSLPRGLTKLYFSLEFRQTDSLEQV